MTIDEFEAFVQGQTPAIAPWTPVTDYSWDARKPIEEPHAQLIKQVFDPATVADIGCGPGHLVRLLRELAIDAKGFDKAIGTPPPLALRGVLYERDIVHWPLLTRADLVICREMLEHLTAIELRAAVHHLVLSTRRWIYVTTRFHPNPKDLLDVAGHDELDPTHITLLNQDFLRALFVLEGCTRRADLEEQMDWKRLGRVLIYERR